MEFHDWLTEKIESKGTKNAFKQRYGLHSVWYWSRGFTDPAPWQRDRLAEYLSDWTGQVVTVEEMNALLDETDPSFGSWIRRQIEGRGPLLQFSKKYGFAPRSIKEWVNGDRSPTDESIAKLATALSDWTGKAVSEEEISDRLFSVPTEEKGSDE